MRCHYSPIRTAEIKTDCHHPGRKLSKLRSSSHILSGEHEAGTGTLQNLLAVSLKAKHTLSVWPSNPTCRYFIPGKEKLNGHIRLCTWTFAAANSIMAKPRTNPEQMCTAAASRHSLVRPSPGHPMQWHGVNYGHTHRKWTSDVFSRAQEARLRRLHPIWLHLCDILEKAEYSDWEEIVVARGKMTVQRKQ